MLSISQNNTWRQRQIIESFKNAHIALNKVILCNFSSNDYLNLSQHSDVKRTFAKAANDYGLGSGSSALVSGYHQSHQALEEAFADFLGRDKALLFNSGYHANLAVFQVLANRHDCIFSDKYCHASLLDGIQLSRAKHIRFAHNNIRQAQNCLDQYPDQKKILVTESIFSMEGNLTDLSNFANLCKKNQTFFCVDDAHGFGVLGTQGRGACEHFNLSQQVVPCLIQPLGKAMGSMGAIVSGSHDLIEAFIQYARSYRYSTALPPAVASAGLVALQVLKNEPWRRIALHQNIVLFNELAKKYQLPLCSWDLTPIRAILVGDNIKTLQLQKLLHERGHFVACIRPSTVPENTARLRISLCSEHRPENIRRLMEDLADVF